MVEPDLQLLGGSCIFIVSVLQYSMEVVYIVGPLYSRPIFGRSDLLLQFSLGVVHLLRFVAASLQSEVTVESSRYMHHLLALRAPLPSASQLRSSQSLVIRAGSVCSVIIDVIIDM